MLSARTPVLVGLAMVVVLVSARVQLLAASYPPYTLTPGCITTASEYVPLDT